MLKNVCSYYLIRNLRLIAKFKVRYIKYIKFEELYRMLNLKKEKMIAKFIKKLSVNISIY